MTQETFDLRVKQAVADLVPTVDDFFSCLQKEAEIIARGSATELESITQEKQELAARLEHCTEEASNRLTAFKCSLPELLAETAKFEADLDKAGIAALRKLSERLAACFKLNQANGIAVQTLSKINRFTLNLVTGQSQAVKLYGAKGTTETSRKTGGAKLGEA